MSHIGSLIIYGSYNKGVNSFYQKWEVTMSSKVFNIQPEDVQVEGEKIRRPFWNIDTYITVIKVGTVNLFAKEIQGEESVYSIEGPWEYFKQDNRIYPTIGDVVSFKGMYGTYFPALYEIIEVGNTCYRFKGLISGLTHQISSNFCTEANVNLISSPRCSNTNKYFPAVITFHDAAWNIVTMITQEVFNSSPSYEDLTAEIVDLKAKYGLSYLKYSWPYKQD